MLPHGREYTELEAAFSLQVDASVKNEVSISGYADLWGWSRGRVTRFLNRCGVTILYPEDTSKKQNQRGQIGEQITSRSGKKNGQIIFNNIKDLQGPTYTYQEKNGQKTDRSADTTRNIESTDIEIKSVTHSCPHQKIISLYHEILPELPKVRIWSEASQKNLRARWNANGQEYRNVEFWEALFKHIRESPFLMGEVKDFRADLTWLVKPSNFEKLVNGRYHTKKESRHGAVA